MSAATGAWAWGLACQVWGAREGEGPARRSALERQGLSATARRPEPTGGAALVRRRLGAASGLAWRPRGIGECEGGAGRRDAGLLRETRACGRRFPREKAEETGWRLLKPKRCLRFLAGLLSPSPIAKAVPSPAEDAATLAFLESPTVFSLGCFNVGAWESPLVAGPTCGGAWSEGEGAWGPAATLARPPGRTRPAATGATSVDATLALRPPPRCVVTLRQCIRVLARRAASVQALKIPDSV